MLCNTTEGKKKYRIVNHQGPDTDCLLSDSATIIIDDINLDDVIFEFVPAGTVYTGPEDDYITIHNDTGGILDPTRRFNDHHFKPEESYKRRQYPSTVSVICEYNANRVNHDRALQEIRELANHRDTPSLYKAEKEKSQAVKKSLFGDVDRANKKNNTNLILTHYQPGPWKVVETFNKMAFLVDEDLMTDDERLRIGIKGVLAWYKEQKTLPLLRELIEKKSQWVEHNGVKYFIIPPHQFRSKLLRSYIRRYYRNQVDVFITKYEISNRNPLSIESVNDNIDGMSAVYDLLTGIEPSLNKDGENQDIYLETFSNFVMHISEKGRINLETIQKAAFSKLTRKPTTKPVEEAEIIEEDE